MGIRESLLNTITSVGNGDFIRIVTSAGASSKATLQNVIKSFETGLGSKSSLTTSDYIRVVGSDNNLYKQSVSSMKSDMGISALEANDGTRIYNGTDLNTLALPANYKKIRVYYGEDITQMTNRPSGISNAWPFCLICLPIGLYYTKQILHLYGTTGAPDNVYVRTQSYITGGTAWTNWAHNGKTEVTVTASANVVIDTNKSYKCGNTLFLNVKGHTTAALSNVSMFVFAGATVNPNSFTFGIPVGPNAWDVNGMSYGYINSNGVVGRIASGQYFHIAQAFLCDL